MPVTDRAALEAAWDRTDEALRLLEALDGDRVRLDRIRHYLRRLPRFPKEPREAFDEVEVFQLKKFHFNRGCLPALLPAGLKARFGLEEIRGGLGALLGTGARGQNRSTSPTPMTRSSPRSARRSAGWTRTPGSCARPADRGAGRSVGIRLRWAPFPPRAATGSATPRRRQTSSTSSRWDAAQLCVRPRAGAQSLRLAEERRPSSPANASSRPASLSRSRPRSARRSPQSSSRPLRSRRSTSRSQGPASPERRG